MSKKPSSYYQRYLKLEPDDAEIYFQLGFLYQKDSNIPKAVESLKKSIELEPQQVASHLALAELYEANHSTAAAQGEYDACTQLDARNPAFYHVWGICILKTRNGTRPASQFESARALGTPGFPPTTTISRASRKEQQRWKDAGTFAEQGIAEPRHPVPSPLAYT